MQPVDYKTVIIYHDDIDGIAAQWMFSQLMIGSILRNRHGLILSHGVKSQSITLMPNVIGKRVYLLGVCYPEPIMRRIVEESIMCMVIDHHKYNAEVIKSCSEIPKFQSIYDNTKCTAELTRDYLFGDNNPPWWLTYVSDASSEKWVNTKWRSFIASLNAMGPTTNQTLDTISDYAPNIIEKFLVVGARHVKDEVRVVGTICKQAVLKIFQGHRVLVSFTHLFGKEVGINLMLEPECAFTAVCYMTCNNTWHIMLRGDTTKLSNLDIDLRSVSWQYGGIGNANSVEFQYVGEPANIFLDYYQKK